MTHNINQKVKSIIAQLLEIDQEEISRNNDFTKDLNASADTITDLFTEIEQKFNINIPHEETENIKTVCDLIGFIEDNIT